MLSIASRLAAPNSPTRSQAISALVRPRGCGASRISATTTATTNGTAKMASDPARSSWTMVADDPVVTPFRHRTSRRTRRRRPAPRRQDRQRQSPRNRDAQQRPFPDRAWSWSFALTLSFALMTIGAAARSGRRLGGGVGSIAAKRPPSRSSRAAIPRPARTGHGGIGLPSRSASSSSPRNPGDDAVRELFRRDHAGDRANDPGQIRTADAATSRHGARRSATLGPSPGVALAPAIISTSTAT